MKSPKNTTLYSRLALITSVTLVVGYFVVYAWTTLSLTDVEPNDTITSTLMQGIVNNINDLNTRVSNFGFSAGNVGIGTSSPATKLHISGSSGVDSELRLTSTTSNRAGSISLYENNIGAWNIGGVNTGANGNLYFTDLYNSRSAMILTNQGNMALGPTTTGGRLNIGGVGGSVASGIEFYTSSNTSGYAGWAGRVYTDVPTGGWGTAPFVFSSPNTSGTEIKTMALMNGNVLIGTVSPQSYKLYVNGTAAGTSAYQNLSDKRFKKNIISINDSLDKILKLNGVYFDWKTKEYPDKNFKTTKDMGVIAQEVEKVFPEAVSTDSNGYKSVAYTNLIAPLIEAIKEQQFQINKQQTQIEELKNEIYLLKK